MATNDHDRLVELACRWLKSKGCGVVFSDRLRFVSTSPERPDAIGWRDNLSILVECKTSRSDFLRDFSKSFRTSEAGMGDWRFLLAPKGVVDESELLEGWVLLEEVNGKVLCPSDHPKGNCLWWKEKPFDGNKRAESAILLAALRKVDKQSIKAIGGY